MTSSKHSSAPEVSHSSRSPSRNPGSGGTTPMFAATGSTTTAAISCPRSSNRARTAVEVVVRSGERVVRRALGDAGRRRDAQGRESAAGALRQQRVGMPVVAARELHDEIAARGAARQADRPTSSPPCPTDTSRTMSTLGTASTIRSASSTSSSVGAPNVVPAAAAAVGGLHDLRAGVTEQQRAPRLHQVDVPVPVDVDQVRALASLDEDRRAAHAPERPHRRVDPAGDHLRAHARRALPTAIPTRHAARTAQPSASQAAASFA